MRRFTLAWMLLVLIFFLPPAEAAAQDARQAFTAGNRSFSEGDYLRALAHFQTAREAGIQGPAVHYNIGVCHYRLGDYRQAAAAFETVADGYPAMRALAQYNLGLVRLKQDREGEARRLFQQVASSTDDARLTRLAYSMLRDTDTSTRSAVPSPIWVSFIDFNVGHDDNVALLDESSVPAGESVDSAFTEVVGVVSGPIMSRPGFRFDGSAYAVRYGDAGEFDQNALRLGGAYQWRRAAWRFEAGPHFNYGTLNGNGFEKRIGARFSVKRSLGARTLLGIRFVHEEVDDIEPQFAFVGGSREQILLTLDRYGISHRLTLGYQLELNDRNSPGVSPTRNGLWLRHRYSMGPLWETDMRLVLRSSGYDDLSVPRDEDLTEVSMAFLRNLGSNWKLSSEYRWSDNRSNASAYSYTRNRLTVGLTKSF